RHTQRHKKTGRGEEWMHRNGLHKLRLRQREGRPCDCTEDADKNECVSPPDKRSAFGSGPYKNPGGEWNSHLWLRIDLNERGWSTRKYSTPKFVGRSTPDDLLAFHRAECGPRSHRPAVAGSFAAGQ